MLAEKEILLKEVKSKINPEQGFIVAGYRSMSANVSADFRAELVKAGGDFFALKKRVFIKATKDEKLEYNLDELNGHVGLVVINDNFPQVAKTLYKFSKENKDAVEVLGAHFEGQKCSPGEVKAISELPTLDEMRAQIIGLLEAPMSRTVGVLDAILTSVIHCLDNKSKQE